MNTSEFEPNRLLMMIQTLSVYTANLKQDANEARMNDLEGQWLVMVDSLHECFSYAGQHKVYLGEFKDELRSIVDNLYNIQRVIMDRSMKKSRVPDKTAKGLISIAEKIDDILAGFGWQRVVKPITVAIFQIPPKILQLFSGEGTAAPLPKSMDVFLPETSTQPTALTISGPPVKIEVTPSSVVPPKPAPSSSKGAYQARNWQQRLQDARRRIDEYQALDQ